MSRRPSHPVPGRRPTTARQRGTGTAKKKSPNTTPSAPAGVDLIPGLQQRLQRELEQLGIPPRRQISTLCRMTARTRPTVTRWVDQVAPGLPDLESFALLCRELNVDSQYLLGLSGQRTAPRGAFADAAAGAGVGHDGSPAWLEPLRRAAAPLLEQCEPVVMQGDDMDPAIRDGDLLFVDRRVTALAGNGTYEIEYMGRRMVRNIEDRLSEGLVLRCANERYADVTLAASSAARSQLRILGKVLRRLRIDAV
jgi:hypothetical protein